MKLTNDDTAEEYADFILQTLLDWRDKNPGFTFGLRHTISEAAKTRNRLKDGWWFQGTHQYVFVPFFKLSGHQQRTRSIGFKIHNIDGQSVAKCNVDIVWRGETDERKIAMYENMVRRVGGCVEVQQAWFQKAFSFSDDVGELLRHFLSEDYPILVECLKEAGFWEEAVVREEEFVALLADVNAAKEGFQNDRFHERLIRELCENEVVKAHLPNFFDAAKFVLEAIGLGPQSDKIYAAIPSRGNKIHVTLGGKYVTCLSKAGRRAAIGFYADKRYPALEEKYQAKLQIAEDKNGVWYSSSPSDLDFKDFYPGMVALALESADAYTKGSQYRSTYAHLHNPIIVEACFSEERRSEFLQIAGGTEHVEGVPEAGTPYDMAQLLDDCFLQESDVTPILTGLSAKKNIILQGPPGTGKTYIAKRLAYALMEEEAKDRVEVVQFHQSYSYEDFIQGFRPKEGGGFERRDGVFFRFCDKARRDPGRDYFFLIDEINRGNLSKIFGELMMLMEADKRGESNRVQLTYSKEGEHFSIPENVHIIGTMNTADRSLAMVDYALRRRFAFFHMPPQFNDKFEAYLQEEHSISASMVKRIVAKLTALNKTIQGDDNLGDGFEIGHSYFCTDVPKGSDEETWYAHIVDHEIGPQLLEYWFDDKKRAEAQIDLLKA